MTVPTLAITPRVFGPKASREMDAHARAIKLLATYGLDQQGWTFAFNRRRNAFGLCTYKERRIELSLPLFHFMKPEAVEDTLLHELAHALVGGGHGHGPVWKAACVRVGARPERCKSFSEALEGSEAVATYARSAKYTLRCPGCSQHVPRSRLPKSFFSCAICLHKKGVRVRMDLLTNY